jgi:mycothiol synthase
VSLEIEFVDRAVTRADGEAVVALANACSLALTGKPDLTTEELLNDWTVPGFSPADDTRALLTPDGRMMGYADLWGHQSPYVRLRSWVRVHPEFRGRGLGTWLNRWVERRARSLLPRAPEGARVTLETATPVADRAALELLAELGFTQVSAFRLMETALDAEPAEPRWPEGVTVRAAAEADDEAVYRARCAAFKDHRGHVDAPFEQGFAHWKHVMKGDPFYDRLLWFVAEQDGEVAGFVYSFNGTGDNPKMGWVHSLGVLRPWRRKGLGRALLLHSFRAFRELGLKRAGLGVDADSLTGATRLYEQAGMQAVEEYLSFEKELRPGKDLSTRSLSA